MAKILIIDDDPVALVLVEHTLVEAGHWVRTSADPSQVISLAIAHSVDLIILEVMMPAISGYEVLRSLRKDPRAGGTPILFLSAKGDSADRIRGLREGADDYLVKPFAPEELVLRVERLVAQATPARRSTSEVSLEGIGKSVVDGRLVSPLYFGRYKAMEVIGEGAMGLVFRGWDPRLKRTVAIKTLRFDKAAASDRGDLVSSLLAEAITVARFNHPHIVSVYDVAEGSETAFMAMEFVDGISLADHLEEGHPLPPSQVIDLALGVARGLAAAHEHRIVHHDVKPGNVLLGFDGSIKVTDFGVAQVVTGLAKSQDKIFGTPGYLPPETLLNEGYSEVGDLFGLGATLYQCLTGYPAVTGRNLQQLMVNTIQKDVVPPHEMAEVPLELSQLVLALLERNPKRRIPNAAEVVIRLQAQSDDRYQWMPPRQEVERLPLSVEKQNLTRSRILTPIAPTEAIDFEELSEH